MFKRHKRLGQVTGEYALLFFIVVGVVGAMTVYVKRSLQARLRGGSKAISKTVQAYTYTEGGVNYKYNGILYPQYEPYYGNRYSEVHTIEDNEKILLPGANTGIYKENINTKTTAQTISEQLPPNQAN